MESNIKIPEKHYVGMVKRQKEKIPLGFITPWGTDSAAQKRMATVDSWSKRHHPSSNSLPALTIDNVPMNGFKMTTDIRSSSYGGSDRWRIEDPRGFELEISSHNLAQLLSVGMIDRGEIMDTCVWARLGQQNILLSTATEEYKNAVSNTAVAAMSASWQDAKIGNTVLLQNNVKGVWLGRMYAVSFDFSFGYNSQSEHSMLSVSNKSMHVIYINEPTGRYQHTLLLASSPKLAAITDTAVITDSQAEEMANRLLNDENCYVEKTGYRNFVALTIGSPKFGVNATLSLKPITIASKTHLMELANSNNKYLVFRSTDQSLFNIIHNSRGQLGTSEFIGYMYSKQDFLEHRMVPEGGISNPRGWSRWNHNPFWVQNTCEYVFDEKDQFHAAILNIKTKAGTDIHAFLR